MAELLNLPPNLPKSQNAEVGASKFCPGCGHGITLKSLANAIDESPSTLYAVTTANSAANRLDSLESSIGYIQADTNSLHEKIEYLDKKLDALSLAANQRTVGPKEVGKAFANLADKIKQLQQGDKGQKTLGDLIEPGEAEWIEKMNLKTRKTGTMRKSQLLTI